MTISVAFRVDASLEIGSGHVIRCLTLADGLRLRGAECYFITRPFPGHLTDFIRQRGHAVLELPVLDTLETNTINAGYAGWLGTDWRTDAAQTVQVLAPHNMDWLVVDHYALDMNWESAVSGKCKNVLVIDDLANRRHQCQILLDQNLGSLASDYAELLPTYCDKLIGPKFALLRPEFSSWRNFSITRRLNPQFHNLLIALGGVDKDNVTGMVLNTLAKCQLPPDLNITIIMGQNAPWLEQIQKHASQMDWPTRVLVGVSNMAEIMSESDIAIGAAGGSAWERCALGLPSIVVVLADNQKKGAASLANRGAILGLLQIEEIEGQMAALLRREPALVAECGRIASSIVDGFGVDRVCEKMMFENA